MTRTEGRNAYLDHIEHGDKLRHKSSSSSSMATASPLDVAFQAWEVGAGWVDTRNASSSSRSAPSSIAALSRSGDDGGGCEASLDRGMLSLLSPSESLVPETPPPRRSRARERAGESGRLEDAGPWSAVAATAPSPRGPRAPLTSESASELSSVTSGGS
jgi:hypothetical protein